MNDFGRYGVWTPWQLWPENANQLASAALELESLGYGSVWLGGSPSDDLDLAEAILSATTSLVVGTSIVDMWRSNGAVLTASHDRVSRQFPGRFCLGVGSGHAPSAEERGEAYVRPLTKLRTFLTGKLGTVPQDQRMVAALGPKALETARDLTAGALPYLVPPQHTADARAILGTDRLLIPEQKVFLGADPAQARSVARRRTTMYLSLPNYTTMLRRYGLSDEDLAGEGSDRYVDTVVSWGDADTVRASVNAHLTAGADHIAVQALSADPAPHLPLAELRELSKILIG